MSNRDTAIGLSYFYKTYSGFRELLAEGQGNEGDPGEPLKFKIYQGTEHYALRQILPLRLGDARGSFDEFRQSNNSVSLPESLTIDQLSTLLYSTYGFSRHDKGKGVAWPYHRMTPSARCFFPVECYLWMSQTEGIPSGLYHYDPLHHRLACVRKGDFRSLLGRILGSSLDNSLGILFISALFWKNAFRYRNFSYRLCTQEAGIVVGNALIVAGTLGLVAHTHFQFLDDPANCLLGFEDGEESLLAVLPLYSQNKTSTYTVEPLQASGTTSQALRAEIEPIQPKYIKMSALDRERCRLLLEIDQHSRLESAVDIMVESIPDMHSCDTTQERLTPTPPLPEYAELSYALHTRNSGDMFFLSPALPMRKEVFWEVIRYSLSSYINDLSAANTHPILQLYIAVNNVQGIDKGMYRFCKLCRQLHLLERGDLALKTQASLSVPNINCASANMVCYLVGDYLTTNEVIGNRSYRILHMQSGLVAHRLCVMSAVHGFAARCSDSYHVEALKHLLQLDNSSAEPLFLVVIGESKPGIGTGERYKLSIHP